MRRHFSILTMAFLIAAAPAIGQRPQQGNLNEGQNAPDFTLSDDRGNTSTTLSKLQGKPVVLIFGSCT